MKIGSRLALAAALLVIVVIASAMVASAHALYGSSVPAANSSVSSAPSTVKVLFVEGVNPKGSSLTVAGPSGVADKGDGHVDQNDPNRKTMLVSLKAGLPSGKYTVSWTTVSADDGETANGTFVFTVAAPAASPASKVTSSLPATLPQTGGAPLVPIVVAGALIALVGFGMRRLSSHYHDGQPG